MRILGVEDEPPARLLERARPHRADAAPAAARRFRADIEGLRAIVVTLVVAFHAGVPGVTGGYVGVDVLQGAALSDDQT
jgi:hypothetical protein